MSLSIKLFLEDSHGVATGDVRRFVIDHFASLSSSLNKLKETIHSLFPTSTISSLKYIDEENDKITFDTQKEFNFAVSIGAHNNILKLYAVLEPATATATATPIVQTPVKAAAPMPTPVPVTVLPTPTPPSPPQPPQFRFPGHPFGFPPGPMMSPFGGMPQHGGFPQGMASMFSLPHHFRFGRRYFNQPNPLDPHQQSEVLHVGVRCDGCNQALKGCRYKCVNCPDYDLCPSCYLQKEAHHNPAHFFLPLPNPVPSQKATKWCRKILKFQEMAASCCPTTCPPKSCCHDCCPSPTAPLSGKFIEDCTLEDGTVLEAGRSYTKIWKLCNDGSVEWPVGCWFVCVGGDLLGSPERLPIMGSLKPGHMIDVVVELDLTGDVDYRRHFSKWSLQGPDGKFFGQQVWFDVTVVPQERQPEAQAKRPEVEEPQAEPQQQEERPATEEPQAEPQQQEERPVETEAPAAVVELPKDVPAAPQMQLPLMQEPLAVPAPAVEVTPTLPEMTPAEQAMMATLVGMGFADVDSNLFLMRENKHDMESTLYALLGTK